MTAKTTKPKFLLLDANIIVTAYELGIWQNLYESVEVWVPSIVAKETEGVLKRKIGGTPEEVNLERLVNDGKIKEIVATAQEMVRRHRR